MIGVPRRCSNCGQSGHYRVTCGKEIALKPARAKRRCSLCGEPGHNAITCGRPPRARAPRPPRSAREPKAFVAKPRALSEQEETLARWQRLIEATVARFCARGSNAGAVDKDDMRSVASMALLDAAERFDPGAGRRFSTYAVLRMRGAMIDELRKMTFGPRRRYRDKPDQAYPVLLSFDTLLYDAGEDGATVGDMLAHPGQTPDEWFATEADSRERAARARELLASLGGPSSQQYRVVALHYFLGLTLRETSQVLGVTESRICQVASDALKVIRRRAGVGLAEHVA